MQDRAEDTDHRKYYNSVIGDEEEQICKGGRAFPCSPNLKWGMLVCCLCDGQFEDFENERL